MKKKVLIITYYWPPASGPGVQRFLKFSKFLPENGWEPIIITVKNGSYPAVDETLLADIPETINVIKTKTMEPFKIYNMLRGKKGKKVEVGMGNIKDPDSFSKKFFNYIRSNYFIPDARVGWNKFAYKAAKKVISLNNIHAIITTGPPHSTHLVGLKLKENLSVKWIADLRDPWTTIAYEKYLKRNKKSEDKNQSYEKEVIIKSDLTLVVSEGMKTEFILKHKCNSVKVIPNGFDLEDLPQVQDTFKTQKFKLCYVGNFKISQNTVNLWKAIKDLMQEESGFTKDFRLSITGNLNSKIKQSIEENNIIEVVDIHPFVKHQEAVDIMFNANLLLLPIPQAENNKLILTGKIFEYLASQNPILGIGPSDGNASGIMQECGREKMFEYKDYDGIKEFILQHYTYWKKHNGVSLKIKDENYKKYSRKKLTAQLANVLNSIV